jgi:hypothetical protein
MRYINLLLLLLPVSATQAADSCYPNRLAGSYAFQIAGKTSISGAPQPATVLGRITFDDGGKVSGTSSVKIAGFLLGNPVTGTYEAKADCTVAWQLQDDSGAFQHFSGKYTPDGIRVQFRQTDSGGVPGGIMIKTPDSCASSDLKRQYSFTVSGSTTPMNPGEVARTVTGKGVIDTTRDGGFQVDSDCAVHFTLTLPAADGQSESPLIPMRGFLVNGGKEILAFEPDPGAMVSARLTGLASAE